MKRFVVTTLAATCGLLLSTTAHASFAEKQFLDDPGWKTQEEVDAGNHTRIDARTAVPSDTVEQRKELERQRDFNETDDGGDARFGDGIRLREIRLPGSSSITRAEFTALLVRARYGAASIGNCYWDITSVHPPRFELLFRDVPVDHEYAPEICVAMRDGLVRGYGDDIFRPDAQITFADASKILARSHGLTPWADPSKPTHWFDPYVVAMGRRKAIPLSIEAIEERITVDEAREMLDRLGADDRDRPSRTADELIAAWERTYNPPRVTVPTRPRVTTPRPTTGSASSAASRASAATVTPTPSSVQGASAAASQASSRPKAWYEF